MKRFKKLMAYSLVPALIPFTSVRAQEASNPPPLIKANDTATVAVETPPQPTNDSSNVSSMWEKAKSGLFNSNLRTKVNLPTVKLAEGLDITSVYNYESMQNIPGIFSGVDIWDFNLNAYSQLFGLDPSEIAVGSKFSRQVTFMRQYPTRVESLKRLPYDPLTKIPKTSDKFFSKTKNPFTGVEEPTFQPGDFVAYRAPITFSLGKEMVRKLREHLRLAVGVNYVVSGEFDVHVFVMNNNMVRVKLIMAEDVTKGGYISMNLFEFTGVGKVLWRLLNTELLQLYFNKTKTDIFTGDYVFNLNTPAGREQYDLLVGSRMSIMSTRTLKEQLSLANPFKDEGSKINKMLASFDDVNSIADEDMNLPLLQRRVIKVTNFMSDSNGENKGHNAKLTKFIYNQHQESKSTTHVTIIARGNSGDKTSLFKLDRATLQDGYKLIFWGDSNVRTTSLLTQIDPNNSPSAFVGLEHSRLLNYMKMSGSRYKEYTDSLRALLPNEIWQVIEEQKPDWDFSNGSSARNVRIEEFITFNDKLFEIPLNLSTERISQVLQTILRTHKNLKADPMAIASGGGYSYSEQEHPARVAFNQGDFVTAYGGGWENYIIPNELSVALNSNYPYIQRYQALERLNSTVPLFNEISSILLVNLLRPEQLKEVLVARLIMSARDSSRHKTVIATYPRGVVSQSSDLFRSIIDHTSYFSKNSFNLRYYIKEDGSLYTLEEIVASNK